VSPTWQPLEPQFHANTTPVVSRTVVGLSSGPYPLLLPHPSAVTESRAAHAHPFDRVLPATIMRDLAS
jgi:hypothetical protein